MFWARAGRIGSVSEWQWMGVWCVLSEEAYLIYGCQLVLSLLSVTALCHDALAHLTDIDFPLHQSPLPSLHLPYSMHCCFQ